MGISPTISFDECGVHCHGFSVDDAYSIKFCDQVGHEALEPVWADSPPEAEEGGGVVRLL